MSRRPCDLPHSWGTKDFRNFTGALEELVRNKLNSIQRMKVTYGHVPEAEILDTVFQSDIEIIKLTMEHIDHAAFEMAVETLLSARTIYIIGIRSCAPLASFLSFYLNMILDDVRLIQTSSASEIFEQMNPYRRSGCNHRHQFSAVFHANLKGN